MIEQRFKSPKGMLKDFLKNSVIWHDLKLVMDDWIEDAKREMENPTLSLDLRELDYRSGVIAALKRFKEVNLYIYQDEEEVDEREE